MQQDVFNLFMLEVRIAIPRQGVPYEFADVFDATERTVLTRQQLSFS